MPYSAGWITRQREKGLDILVAGKTPQEVYEQADIMRRYGYKPKGRVLVQKQQTPYPYYQWWQVVFKPNEKLSARREGLVSMSEGRK